MADTYFVARYAYDAMSMALTNGGGWSCAGRGPDRVARVARVVGVARVVVGAGRVGVHEVLRIMCVRCVCYIRSRKLNVSDHSFALLWIVSEAHVPSLPRTLIPSSFCSLEDFQGFMRPLTKDLFRNGVRQLDEAMIVVVMRERYVPSVVLALHFLSFGHITDARMKSLYRRCRVRPVWYRPSEISFFVRFRLSQTPSLCRRFSGVYATTDEGSLSK